MFQCSLVLHRTCTTSTPVTVALDGDRMLGVHKKMSRRERLQGDVSSLDQQRTSAGSNLNSAAGGGQVVNINNFSPSWKP